MYSTLCVLKKSEALALRLCELMCTFVVEKKIVVKKNCGKENTSKYKTNKCGFI